VAAEKPRALHEYPDDIRNMKFSLAELKDINMIRQITRGSLKDLGDLLNERAGRVPIFGYPLVCYSPNHSEHEVAEMLLHKQLGS